MTDSTAPQTPDVALNLELLSTCKETAEAMRDLTVELRHLKSLLFSRQFDLQKEQKEGLQ